MKINPKKVSSMFTIAFSLAILIIQAALANTCSDYSNCSSCAINGNCMWVLLYDCTEVCIERGYTDPDGINARNVIWRSEVHNETQCPYKEECEIMEGDVPNPSFENWEWVENDEVSVPGVTKHEPWILTKIISSVRNCSGVFKASDEQCKKQYAMGLDGNFFLFLGENKTSDSTQVYEVSLDDTLKISEGATHLSFFYALPYYTENIFSKTLFSPFISRTALDVYIDNEHVLRMDKFNLNITMYNRSNAYYHPMNINVTKFADGKKHSMKFYFVKEANMYGQLMLIDYVQVIKSNYNGNTFDEWEGNYFNSKSSCEKYCLQEYIRDYICDVVCVTNGCNNDGGDCDYILKPNTKTNLTVILIVVIIVIVILVVSTIIVVMLIIKKRAKDEINPHDVEIRSVKKKWNVSTRNIMFGGKEADIGIALKDSFAVSNYSKSRSFSVALIDEERCSSDMRFKVTIKPKKFSLEKNEEQTVSISIKIFCTTTITERIEIKVDESLNEDEVINLVASGKKSTRINPYDLVYGDVIGEGGFGIVYRGIYKSTYDVAIKKLRSADDMGVADFNNEADILEKINSEYTIKFYGALVTDDYYCFVTEFAPCKSFNEVLKTQEVPSSMKIRYLCDIARGMEYLHSINIIHRDLKPGNILCFNTTDPMFPKAVCKISDFGGSKIIQNTANQNMTKGVGTFIYMAPEILNGDTHYDKSVDVFSFGVMMSEVLGGRRPYSDNTLSRFELVKHISQGGRPTIPDNIPPVLKDLMVKCWSQEPSHRPPFSEVRQILDTVRSNLINM